jgi:acyl dehydratase
MSNEVYARKDLGVQTFIASPELIQQYIDGIGDRHPWYTGDSPFGGPVAPALIFSGVSSLFSGWRLENPFGNLYTRQEWELHHPARPGERLSVAGQVADRYIRRNRDIVALEMILRNARGELTARGVHHQSFLLEQKSGEVRLRDPKAKEGAKIAASPTGREIASLKKAITLDMSLQYFGGVKNYHTDKTAAQTLGFKDVVIGGRIELCLLSELMTREFGVGWFQGGRMDIKFTNVLWLDEPLNIRGFIRDRTPEGAKTRVHLEIIGEKVDGTRTIVGTASALQ